MYSRFKHEPIGNWIVSDRETNWEFPSARDDVTQINRYREFISISPNIVTKIYVSATADNTFSLGICTGQYDTFGIIDPQGTISRTTKLLEALEQLEITPLTPYVEKYPISDFKNNPYACHFRYTGTLDEVYASLNAFIAVLELTKVYDAAPKNPIFELLSLFNTLINAKRRLQSKATLSAKATEEPSQTTVNSSGANNLTVSSSSHSIFSKRKSGASPDKQEEKEMSGEAPIAVRLRN